jgi:hypothetical protein
MKFEKLRDVIVDQAKHFLLEAGEFYPFGGVVNSDGNITPLGVYLENDRPSPQDVIGLLEKAIIAKFHQREVSAAGICVDVHYRPTGEANKKSAIQIRMLGDTGESADYCLPYSIKDNTFVYESIFIEKGTLNFLKIV